LIALIRTFFFIFFISALWALLPVIVRQELRLGAPGYGLLLGCIGVGAVVGAAVLPLIQRKIPVVDQQVIISTVALSLVKIALGFLRNLLLLCLIATIGGTAWIMLVSSFNVAAQEASPAWVRARALGAYLVVYKKVPSWYRSSTASTQIRPRTSSALCTRSAECAKETKPSAGSSRATRPMKIAMSRHLWPSPGWTICASSTA